MKFFPRVFLGIKISIGGHKKPVSYGRKFRWLLFLIFFGTQLVFLIKGFLINSYCVYVTTYSRLNNESYIQVSKSISYAKMF